LTNTLGIIRFSVLSTGENHFSIWRRLKLPFEEYAANILDDKRLASRFALFENICLTSLDAQTYRDFKVLLLAPRLLGSVWRTRLERLAASRDYLQIEYVHEDEFSLGLIKDLALQNRMIDSSVSATFRLDDDDAIHKAFLERLQFYVREPFIGHVVSQCRGFYLDTLSGDGNFAFERRTFPNTAVGLSYVGTSDDFKTIFDVSYKHRNIHHHAPVIVDGRQLNFLTVIHDNNSTGDQWRVKAEKIPYQEIKRSLRRNGIAVNLDRLLAASKTANLPVSEEL
jgi:hypothetical protein